MSELPPSLCLESSSIGVYGPALGGKPHPEQAAGEGGCSILWPAEQACCSGGQWVSSAAMVQPLDTDAGCRWGLPALLPAVASWAGDWHEAHHLQGTLSEEVGHSGVLPTRWHLTPTSLLSNTTSSPGIVGRAAEARTGHRGFLTPTLTTWITTTGPHTLVMESYCS